MPAHHGQEALASGVRLVVCSLGLPGRWPGDEEQRRPHGPVCGATVHSDPCDMQVHRDPLLCPCPIYLAPGIPQGDFLLKIIMNLSCLGS